MEKKELQILKTTYHLISRSPNGKRAMIVKLDHLSNGKYASQTCHAVIQLNGEWGLLLLPLLGLGISVPESKLINGMERRKQRIHERTIRGTALAA